jgi:hypothetical protein
MNICKNNVTFFVICSGLRNFTALLLGIPGLVCWLQITVLELDYVDRVGTPVLKSNTFKDFINCEVSGSHGGEYEDEGIALMMGAVRTSETSVY